MTHSTKLNVCIGFDQVESISWHTCVHSIFKRSSHPVKITPVYLNNLSGVFTRERNEKQSNEFSFSRFLTPYLNDYKDWAIFMDCDMMLQTDIYDIFKEVHKNPGKAVYVVKHDYTPKNEYKYLGAKQHKYPRKNWSSFILWDCSHPSNKKVTPEFVNNASPMELHRFLWLKDDEIGELDITWNWLVQEYDLIEKNLKKEDIKVVHWTNGGPYFNEYSNVEFSEEWNKEKESVNFCLQNVENNSKDIK